MVLALSFIFVAPFSVEAGDFDGSKLLLCAIVEGFDCALNVGECLEIEAEDMNIPKFLNINFKEKTISGTRENGELATTKMENTVRKDGTLIL